MSTLTTSERRPCATHAQHVASRERLAAARPTADRLLSTVRTALGRPTAEVVDWWVDPVPYVPGTPSTGGLHRVRGTASDADDDELHWSIFVKVLQSPARWEHLHLIPEQLRQFFVDNFPWRLELDVLGSDIASRLPEDVRLPDVYDVHDIDVDLVAVWMEDVRGVVVPWDADRFRRAAYALGRLAARRRTDRAEPFRPGDPQSRVPGMALRYYVDGRVQHGAIEPLGDAALWNHPTLAGALAESGELDLPTDFAAASRRVPELLDHLDTLPQTYVHGDASPQNLLVPEDRPDTFVVIDWGFDSPHAIGFDLGQLLVGLAHAGELRVDELPAIHDAIVASYVAGARAEGMAVSEADVYDGYVGSLVVRAAFTALPIEALDEPSEGAAGEDAVARLWIERIRLTRYLIDLAATVPTSRPGAAIGGLDFA